jgi:hypothetical protein
MKMVIAAVMMMGMLLVSDPLGIEPIGSFAMMHESTRCCSSFKSTDAKQWHLFPSSRNFDIYWNSNINVICLSSIQNIPDGH